MQFSVERFEEVDSTNLIVRAALERGGAAGYVARARVQTGGYGRQGRSWVSPAGGLYQSLLLRPARAREEWPTLALVVALGLRAGLLDFGRMQDVRFPLVLDEAVEVKWPNDLMVGARKLAGISCEAHGGGVCVGIGVNIFVPLEDAGMSILGEKNAGASGEKNAPAYLCNLLSLPQEASNEVKDSIIAACGDSVLQGVGCFLEQWEREGFAAFQRQYCETCNLLGKFVQLVLVSGGTLAQGIVRDIDASGRLVIEDEAHNIQAFFSGEVHIQN